MGTMAFIGLINSYIWIYAFFLGASFLSYALFLSKRVKSIFNPLFFSIVFTNSICTANVLLMGYADAIRADLFANYLMTEAAFIAGFLIFSGGRHLNFLGGNGIRFKYDREMTINVLMYLSFALMAVPNLALFAVAGIPLFMESRYDATIGGVGLGLLIRIGGSANIVFLASYFLKYSDPLRRKLRFDIFMIVLSLLIGFFSGYKAFFLGYLSMYYLVNRDRIGRSWALFSKRTIAVCLVGSIVIIVLFMIILRTWDVSLAFMNLLYRIVASGDVYYMSYGNAVIESLPHVGFWYQLFGSTMASFRLIGWEAAPKNLGILLNQTVNNYSINAGPTFRYNVLWLYLSGFTYSIFLSFFTGAVVGFLEKASRSFRYRSIGYVAVVFLYMKSFQLILGPDQAINEFFFSAIYLGIVFFFVEAVYWMDRSNRMKVRFQ